MLVRAESEVAWELRGHWAARRPVVVTLTSRCIVDRVEGLVEKVAVTGAFAVIDGWHVPVADILAVHRPHFEQNGAT